MANIKISELTALTPPDAADLVPVTDSSASQTKRTTVGEIVGIINGDVDVADDGTATISELPVSKLQDGDARQLLQTDAAGTGVEWTSDVDVPGTLDVTGATTLDSTLGVNGQSTLASAAVSDLTSGRVVLAGMSGELEDSAGLTFDGTQLDVDGDVVITGDLTVEGASTILETETVKVEDKNIELGVVTSPTDVTADGGGITLKGDTDKTINWVDATDAWTSSEHIDLASGKEFYIDGNGVLNATTLGSGVVNSSLTSVGTISSGTWQGTAIDDAYLDTISTAGKVSNSATTATSANTASAIVARDASGDFSAGTITADLTGNADTATALSSTRTFEVTGDITGTVSSDLTSGASIATSIASGVIVDADVNASAAIAGTKIDPDFGSQNVTTTGTITGASLNISSSSPRLTFTDTDTGADHRINADSGAGNLAFDVDFNSDTASPALIANIKGTERLRVDASGRLLLGTSSDTGNFLLQTEGQAGDVSAEGGLVLRRGLVDASIGDGSGLGSIDFAGQSGGVGAQIRGIGDAQWGTDDYPARLVFSTTADGASSPTERMRIGNDGRTNAFAASETLRVRTAATTAAASIAIRLQAGATSITAGGTTEFQVTSNGNVTNTNNSYGAISDIKLKENIVGANSQWSDIKALQVRNYNFKQGQTHTQIGLVAQEVELVSPGLVSESPDLDEDGNDLGTVTKSVNYSVLYMKAVKALQEAMERIETLEAKVAALEQS